MSTKSMLYYSTCGAAARQTRIPPNRVYPDSTAPAQNMILWQQLMDVSTSTLVLGTDDFMQRRIRREDHKFSVDKCVAGGVCSLLEDSTVERLYQGFSNFFGPRHTISLCEI